MVPYCLLSYSLGCILLNVLSWYLTDADTLMNFVAILITVAVIPNFIFLEESPRFLYDMGYVTKFVKTLKSIGEKNDAGLSSVHFEERLGISNVNLNNYKYKDIRIDNNQSSNQAESIETGFSTMFKEKEVRFTLVALCIQSATIFTIYYGLTSSMQDLGLKSTQWNGILMGFTQFLGFAIISYYGPNLERVKSATFCLVMEIIGAIILYILTMLPYSNLNSLAQSLVSTLWMTTVVSAHMSLLYFQNAESFPTEIKGKAIACILLFGKLSGACAPIIEEYTKRMGTHVLCGCSAIALIALPLVANLKETLIPGKKDIAFH